MNTPIYEGGEMVGSFDGMVQVVSGNIGQIYLESLQPKVLSLREEYVS